MTAATVRLLALPDVAALLSAFAAAGTEARLVGGAVRDAVMGRPPGDIDIATQMLPQDVMALARRKGWKAVPTGVEHGTVTIVISGRPYEVTTLRRDVETDGRRAVVAFTDDFREDAFRRDFTLNALSLSADGVVHDYARGVADAQAGLIRFMGDPASRIREDYLRILRFFRFQASHGRGAPDADALAACRALKVGMAQLSRERVRSELVKLIAAPGAAAAVAGMDGIDLWPQTLPGVAVDVAAFRRWVSLAQLFPSPATPMSGLAALAPLAPPAALAENLKLSAAERETLRLIRTHGRLCLEAATLREAVHRIGPKAFPAVLRASAAIEDAGGQAVRGLLALSAPILADPPRQPFRSADAAALGVAAGPRMGRVLKRAEASWIAAGLPASDASGFLRKAVAETPD
jgi:poly(A) polymerase